MSEPMAISDRCAILVASLLSSLATLLLKERFDRRRQANDRANWQLVNLRNYYFDQYLTADVKECRLRLQTAAGKAAVNVGLAGDRQKLSHALERIGVMTYLGGIPLSYAFIMNAFQIVGDWLLIAEHVRLIRDTEVTFSFAVDLPYERRHAEWLALITYMWLTVRFFRTSASNDRIMRDFEHLYDDNWNKIRKKERLLFSSADDLVARSTYLLARQVRWRFLALQAKRWPKSRVKRPQEG